MLKVKLWTRLCSKSNFGLDYAQSQTIAKPNNLKGFGSKKIKYKIAKIS